jgi:glycosyltransferase involved in cell wall biosynthesis
VTVTVTVTVVVSTLDRPATLARCVQALLVGSSRPDELVVVDQGEPEGTARALEPAREAGIAVQHVRQPRLGLSASQNAGVRAAGSAVVAVVDDDCVPDTQWVEVVRRAFADRTAPLLLTGRVLPLPPVGERTLAVSSRLSTDPQVWTAPTLPWLVGTGGNFAVTRTAYLDVEGNDERLGTGTPGRGGNDLDLFQRQLAAGVHARYEPDLVVEHERSTVAEHRSRRGSYGFGLGAAAGRWLRAREPYAPGVLRAWVSLRVGLVRRERTWSRARDEARVLLGTVAGLAYGLRLPARGRGRAA